jgi:hypothetical protein
MRAELLLMRPRECLPALNIIAGAVLRPGGLALGVIDVRPLRSGAASENQARSQQSRPHT